MGKRAEQLKCVNKIKIKGKVFKKEEIKPEDFNRMLEGICERGMEQIGFHKIKSEK